MARPNRNRTLTRSVIGLVTAQFAETAYNQTISLFSPPGGVWRNAPTSRLERNKSVVADNLRIDNGVYIVRDGTAHLGTPVANVAFSATTFGAMADGSEYIVGAAADKFYRLDDPVWTPLTGPTLTVPSGEDLPPARYSFSAWDNRVIYANGVDPVGEINLVSGTYAALAGAPVGQFVVTTAGRVVVGRADGVPNRVRWCVRNNNVDWSGTSSGYEDLLATPGGVVDAIMGMFVIDDLNTIVVRARSVWLMTQTGLVDAPFSFHELYKTPGTDSPWSFVNTPYGVVGQFRDSVYLFSNQQPLTDIGLPVRSAVMDTERFDASAGTYDPWAREYVVSLQRDEGAIVWRYNFISQAWTSSQYDFRIVHIAAPIYNRQSTLGELGGGLDELPGTFDLLGNSSQSHGIIFSSNWSGEPPRTEHSGSWVDTEGTIRIDLQSGIVAGDPLYGIRVTGVVLEYMAPRNIEVTCECSIDGGQSWRALGVLVCPTSSFPVYATIDAVATLNRPVFRLRATDAGGLQIVALMIRSSVEDPLAN